MVLDSASTAKTKLLLFQLVYLLILRPSCEPWEGQGTRHTHTHTHTYQCLQLPRFVRVFPELRFGKRTTDIDRIITEIDYHV